MIDKEVFYGTVVWFSSRKGFGYLKPDVGDKDFFVHWTQIVDKEDKFKTLVSGQRVAFVIGENKSGPQAEQVTVIADAPEEE